MGSGSPRLFSFPSARFVISLIRIPRQFLCAFVFAGAVASYAEDVAALPQPMPDLPPDLAALVAAQSIWSMWAAVEAGFGYKDNLLLSHIDEERSAFTRSAVKFLPMRARRGAMDLSFFTHASGT